MADHLIVVVNRVKARFFTIKPVNYPINAHGPKIIEIFSLINPEVMSPPMQLYAEAKPLRGSPPTGRSVQDDPNKPKNYVEKPLRRFAVKLSARIHKLVNENNFRTVIVAPSTKMRRFLYPHLEILALKGPVVYKVPKNMINFSPSKIHNLLANYGLTPKQKRQLA